MKFDVYASTERVYMFVEDRPAGCAILPSERIGAGPVNVFFHMTGYHIEIDAYVEVTDRHQYWARYSKGHVDRKLDDLGIQNGASLPDWDEAVMPCGTDFQ